MYNRRRRLSYYAGNIVKNLQGRYDRITRKSTTECRIAEGDFLIPVYPIVILLFAGVRPWGVSMGTGRIAKQVFAIVSQILL